jgi:hypothetical protein
MALQVIGSGLGRHHMVEVFRRPEAVPLWIAASEGRPDWDAIFDGYAAATDYPAVAFWRELIDVYPEAKVVHTTRDPQSWFESAQATIFAEPSPAAAPAPPFDAFFTVMRAMAGPAEQLHDRDGMIAFMKQHDAAVRAAVPEERLLVYQVSQGWRPLCDFLGVAVPPEPFPRANTREEFTSRPTDEHGMPDLSALDRAGN